MPDDFKPLYTAQTSREFNVWDYSETKSEKVAVVDHAQELEAQLKALKEEGKKQGYAEGMKQAQDEIDAKKKELAQLFELVQKPVQLMDEALTHDVVKTIIWLCKSCINIELSVHPEKLKGLIDLIKDELPLFKSSQVLHMNPEDVDWIDNNLNKDLIPGLKDFLSANPELKRGDFYLRSDDSELDGSLETRLHTLFAKHVKSEDFLEIKTKPTLEPDLSSSAAPDRIPDPDADANPKPKPEDES